MAYALATLVGWVLRAPFDNAPLGARSMVAVTKTVPVCAKKDGMVMDVSWKDARMRAPKVESVCSGSQIRYCYQC